jgi:hypothetical protein
MVNSTGIDVCHTIRTVGLQAPEILATVPQTCYPCAPMIIGMCGLTGVALPVSCAAGQTRCNDPSSGVEFCNDSPFCPVQCAANQRHCGGRWLDGQQVTQDTCVDFTASCPCMEGELTCPGPRYEYLEWQGTGAPDFTKPALFARQTGQEQDWCMHVPPAMAAGTATATAAANHPMPGMNTCPQQGLDCREGLKHCPGHFKHAPTATDPNFHVRTSEDSCVLENEMCPCSADQVLCDAVMPTVGGAGATAGTHAAPNKYCHHGAFCPVHCPSTKNHCGGHWTDGKQITSESCVDVGTPCPCHPNNDLTCPGHTIMSLDATGTIVNTAGPSWCLAKDMHMPTAAGRTMTAAGTAATCPVNEHVECKEGLKHCGGEWKLEPTATNPHHHVRVSPDTCVVEGSPCPCHQGQMLCDDVHSPTAGSKFCHMGEFCPIKCPTGQKKCGSHYSKDGKQLTAENCV